MPRYFVLNKPYNMVSQFVSPDTVNLLTDIDFDFPEGTHAVGRLDGDSEGLLLLTTDKRMTRMLFQGSKPHRRDYIVRVKGIVTDEELNRLCNGLLLPGKGMADYRSQPCSADKIPAPDWLAPRPNQPDFAAHTWLRISLFEGRYRQVRKMVYAIGHKCQRLVRVAIEDLELGDLQPGALREYTESEIFRLLRLD